MTTIGKLIFVDPSCTRLVVTDLTDRSTNLKHIQEFHILLDERLFAQHPTNRHSGEEVEAVLIVILLRAVVGTIEFCKITCSIVISQTEYPVLTVSGENTTSRLGVAAEQAQGCHLMIAELTGIVQLQGVIQLTIGTSYIYTSCCGSPTHLLLVWCILCLVPAGVVADVTRFRVDVLIERVIVLVIDTTAALVHCIIIRKTTLELQSLCNEVQFLLQDEVGGNLRIRSALVTSCSQIGNRVGLVSITGSVEAI